jgi:hypothetical protein
MATEVFIGGVKVTPVSHVVLISWESGEAAENAANLFCTLFQNHYSRQFHVVQDMVWKRNMGFHPFGGDTQVRICD